MQEQRGFPWAFAIALLLVAALEVGLRVTGWPKKIPYDLGMDEYYAASAQIDRYGPAEVSIVGSSRTRESIDVPVLKRTIEHAMGHPVVVGNYAASGARTIDFEGLTKRLLRDKHPPKLIVLGISERDLSGAPGAFDRVSMYWGWDDFKEAWRQSPKDAINYLPDVLRHELADHWWTLRYREQIRLRLRELLTHEHEYTSPASGDNTPWQKEQRRRTLRNFPVTRNEMKRYIHTDLQLKHYPDPELRDALERLCEACKRSRTQLIIYEMPIAHIMMNSLPPGIYDRYVRTVKHIANANGVRFVRLGSLKIKLTDDDFREPSHMGARGAKKFSKALGSRVIGPALESLEKRSQAGHSGPDSTSAPMTRP